MIVQNLTMTAIPRHIWIPRGSSGTIELDLSSINGLSGNVSFWAAVYGNCCWHTAAADIGNSNGSFNPMSVILSPRGIGTTALTINVGQSDNSASLTVEVFALRPSWQFSLNIQVTVT